MEWERLLKGGGKQKHEGRPYKEAEEDGRDWSQVRRDCNSTSADFADQNYRTVASLF